MRNPLKRKPGPSEGPPVDGGQPIVSEFSPLPSPSVHYHEAERTRRPGVEFTVDKLDEPTMHSAFRTAINQWILSDEGWHAEFPGHQSEILIPVLKSIAFHKHGIKMLLGALYKERAAEVYAEIMEELENSTDTFEEQETFLVLKYGELVDMHDLGFRKRYEAEHDVLNPPRDLRKKKDDGGK